MSPRAGTAERWRRVTTNVAILRESLAADRDPEQPRPDPFLPDGIQRLLVRALGRPIVCAACGRQIFKGLPLVWRGQVWLIGAYDHAVRVSFTSSETLEFRHAQIDECPAPERPWIP